MPVRKAAVRRPSVRPARHAVVAAAAVETLERRSLMAANPVITEFVASNNNGLKDGNGVAGDWVEIQNQGDQALNLQGWGLTDNANQPFKWAFPSKTLNPGEFIVVFADSSTGAALTTPDSLGYLHTSFSLSADGENLSLRRPDGSVASQFGPNGAAYPKQAVDFSYGTTGVITPGNYLISTGAAATAIVPTTGALDNNAWTAVGYNDSGWKTGTTGVGFDGGGIVSAANLVAKWDAQANPPVISGTSYSWNSSIGGFSAFTGTQNRHPAYVGNAINGKAALRFDGVNDRLRSNNPLNNVADFSVAFVFSSTAGRGDATGWYNNAGIVDAEVGGVTNDWGVALSSDGHIGGGTGNPDSTTYTNQAGLNDGNAHVVVFAKSGSVTSLSIDGGAPVYGSAPLAVRTVTALAFGSLQTDANYFNGDIGEVRLYNTGLGDDAARSLSTEMAAYWGITPAAGVFTPSIGLDLQAEMAARTNPAFAGASTAAVRVPFTAANIANFDKLYLNMKYDDGFVAYLNGTEVARRNAPAGGITYTSTATGTRTDAAALTAESIDISGFTNLISPTGQNVLAVRALNASAGDGDLILVPELVGATAGPGFMTQPTPGAANAAGYTGLVQNPTASVKKGFYTTPQSVTLTSTTPGATLVYTTNGSAPTLANGTVVNAASGTVPPTVTLNIASTTVVRMAAFREGYLDSQTTAETYLFLPDILTQPEYTPTIPGTNVYWDVGMDETVVQNTTQTWSVAQALTAIPTISLSLEDADMFGAANGIYTHPLSEGDAWERPVSVEYFDPNNPNTATNQFTINAGIRVQGSYSRNTSRPKKGFKLFFRSDYGQSKLEFPVFGTTNPQQAFDHLILRAGHNHSWANDENYNAGDYMRDQFARDTQRALTGKAANGNWAHLYINGQYWGLYNPTEDVDADWAEANYGGNGDDYDIVKPTDTGGVEADDGNLTAYYALFAAADAAVADGVMTPAEYDQLAAQLDMKTLADYMISSLYRGDKDSPVLIGSTTDPRNFIGLRNRVDPSGKWIFQTQDGEISIDDIYFDRTEVKGNLNPGRLHNQLRNSSPEYRQLFVDEFNRAFAPGGPLTVAVNQARYNAIKAKIDKAIVGESARWGNFKAPYNSPVTRDVQWLNETNWITNTYMPQRDTVIKNLMKADFPELNTLAPTVSVNGQATTGGQFATNSPVTLSNLNATPAGTVYYTLDGTDPRSPGGTASATAVAYTGFFALPGARTVNARVLRNGVWSPLTTVSLTVAPPSLRLTELMYHPGTPVAGGPFVKDDYEYLELTNTGVTPVDLSGMRLNTGALYTVPNGTTLAAGAKGYLVKNANAFQYGYGTSRQVLGVYSDNLSNSGEQVTLFDPNSGTNVFDVTYLDAWQPTTDGGGFALKVINPGPSQAQPAVLGVAGAWQASGPGGTPGPIDTAPTKVTALTVDDGTAQRSLVRTVTVDLSRSATAAGAAAGAFTLTQAAGTPLGPVAVSVSGVTPLPGGASRLTLAFTQQGNNGPGLADGRYTLVVDGTKLTDFAGATADAAGTGVRGSQRALDLHRLSGDVDGDASVTFNDFVALQTAFGTNAGQNGYVGGADLTADGVIDFDDFVLLQSNFGKTV